VPYRSCQSVRNSTNAHSAISPQPIRANPNTTTQSTRKDANMRCKASVVTNLGIMRPTRVTVFSGGGPPLMALMMRSESSKGTAFTVPYSHPSSTPGYSPGRVASNDTPASVMLVCLTMEERIEKACIISSPSDGSVHYKFSLQWERALYVRA
jgi:hypothetical protein